MAKRILIVDDEPSVVKGLRFSLEKQEGYITDVAYDGQAAVDTFEMGEYDLVLLDLMLPRLGGMEVCQRIRSTSDVPIIMLTAKGDDMDKIMGLEYGADDYLTKPFNMLELKARIKNILRRAENAENNKKDTSKIEVKDITLDLINRNVSIGDREVNLTAKEFELLHLFAMNRGHVYDRESLLELIWRQKGDLRTVDVHIRRLREKIEKNPAEPVYILTKWGVGYYFSDK
ncbi:MAG: response regulator transcription factor [Clostridia bacterium]|nr:response regulator transcription factor [Clostridia bacterium]